MRAVLLALAVLLGLSACASTPPAHVLTDAERCARFGGSWSHGTCRVGAP